MTLESYISDFDNCIKFGKWLHSKQTQDEIQQGETIIDNKIGFNSPDSKALNSMFICLRTGTEFETKDLYLWVELHLRRRLLKYKKQFKVYQSTL